MTFETHTIVLGDGTEIKAVLNGNNYITSKSITMEDLTEDNLIGMTIDGAEQEDQVCTNCWTAADGTHIIFHELTPENAEIAELRAQVEYLMMMGGFEV